MISKRLGSVNVVSDNAPTSRLASGRDAGPGETKETEKKRTRGLKGQPYRRTKGPGRSKTETEGEKDLTCRQQRNSLIRSQRGRIKRRQLTRPEEPLPRWSQLKHAGYTSKKNSLPHGRGGGKLCRWRGQVSQQGHRHTHSSACWKNSLADNLGTSRFGSQFEGRCPPGERVRSTQPERSLEGVGATNPSRGPSDEHPGPSSREARDSRKQLRLLNRELEAASGPGEGFAEARKQAERQTRAFPGT